MVGDPWALVQAVALLESWVVTGAADPGLGSLAGGGTGWLVFGPGMVGIVHPLWCIVPGLPCKRQLDGCCHRSSSALGLRYWLAYPGKQRPNLCWLAVAWPSEVALWPSRMQLKTGFWPCQLLG